MKYLALLRATSLFTLGLLCSAQDSDAGKHAPAAATFERFQSILIPPVLHAPFSSTVTAEWTPVLEDSGTITVQNHRPLVGDSAGRI
jgi:hypothetical protein